MTDHIILSVTSPVLVGENHDCYDFVRGEAGYCTFTSPASTFL